MSNGIVECSEFDYSTIKYSKIKANASGGKSLYVLNGETSTSLMFIMPKMLTWGLSDFEGNEKYELGLQFPSEDYNTEELTNTLRVLQEFEAKIKSDALSKSKEWFGKVHNNPEVIDALWTPMLKYPKDKMTGEPNRNMAPTLRVKASFYESEWKNLSIYKELDDDEEDEELLFPNKSSPTITPLDLIQKGTKLATVIKCGGLWFANGKFGITWKLIQAVIEKPKQALSGCLIKTKRSSASVTPVPTQVQVPTLQRAQSVYPMETARVNDSDEEDESNVEVEEENDMDVREPEPEQEEVVVAPVPVPDVVKTEEKKKKVVKKKI
jgi:hypothetical protein